MSGSFVVVMGVSGSGKTTLARGLAYAMDRPFAEGDDFHPAANVAKMRAGTPLTDADRRPWLESIRDWMSERAASGQSAVLTCSALRRPYRDLLRQADGDLRFLHVDPSRRVLEQRVAAREGHYMPASLLDSQLATLEPLDPDEPGVRITGEGDADAALHEALTALGLHPVRPLPPPPGALERIEAIGPYRNV